MSDGLPIQPITDRETAFAFVLGVLFNQQMRAEYAWQAPYVLAQRLNGLAPEYVVSLGEEVFQAAFVRTPAIHPFTSRMAANAFEAAYIVIERYAGDARAIWTPRVYAGEFMDRLMEFPGIGEHKARIALFVATTQLGIAVADDGGDYNIRDCASLAQLFYPQSQPILTTP